MGYECFGNDLTRPLYGYVGQFKSGEVPAWAKKPVVSAHKVIELFELDREDYSNGIPRRKLPDGVSRKNRRHGPAEYEVETDVYLQAHRDRITTADNKHRYSAVEFKIDSSDSMSGFGNSYNLFPDEIDERLGAIRDTGKWDAKIDGYHYSFREWVLAYEIGDRGAITDVSIKASIRH